MASDSDTQMHELRMQVRDQIFRAAMDDESGRDWPSYPEAYDALADAALVVLGDVIDATRTKVDSRIGASLD